jgi:hypothetical protein
MHANLKRGLVPAVVATVAMAFAQGAIAQTNLDASMTVDNAFIAYISTDDAVAGLPIGSGSDWTVTYPFSTALTPGVTNYLHIEATNAGGVAAFIGEFTLDNAAFHFADGTQSLLSDTANWQVSSTGFGANYVAPADLGVDGTAPWGNTADVDDAAHFLWHPDGDTTTPVYFSAAILPTTADLAVSVVKNHTDPVIAGAGSSDWTFTVTNNGPDATTNIVAGLSASTTGGLWASDAGCTYTASQGGPVTWPTWNVGALASGASATLQEVCPADADSTDGVNREVTLSITSQDYFDDDTANNAATVDATVARETSFALTVDCEPDTVIAGSGAGNMSCLITLAQNGPSDASGVAVDLTLPTGVTVDSADLTNAPGTSFTSPTWTIGSAPVGYSADITLTMTADETATGDLTIVATVTANETITGPDSSDDVVVAEAAGDAPTSFLTTIAFTNGFDGMVTVSISCNNGVPLDQSFEISSTQPVNFVVDLLDFVAPDVNCTISLEVVGDGYVGSFLANGVDTGDACLFSSEPEAGEAPFNLTADRENTCAITAEPVQSEFVVEKLWEFQGDDIIGVSAGIDIWCEPASTTTGPDYGTVSSFVYAQGDDEFSLFFYPHWNGETTCYAEEGNLDSSVESDGGCLGGTDFVIGDDENGCTITNTVFFEGIPTLSQYGLAIMALLMLGLGFVGFRRFV